MHICIYVYMYICIYVCMYLSIYPSIYISLSICVYIYIHIERDIPAGSGAGTPCRPFRRSAGRAPREAASERKHIRYYNHISNIHTY